MYTLPPTSSVSYKKPMHEGTTQNIARNETTAREGLYHAKGYVPCTPASWTHKLKVQRSLLLGECI